MLWGYGLKHYVRKGFLKVIDANGKTHSYGQAGAKPSSTIRLHDKKLHHKLLLNPDLYLGEAYMDQTLTIEEGDLRDLLDVFGVNEGGMQFFAEKVEEKLTPILLRLQQFNPRSQAKQNVAHHYDLSEQLYRLFLDEDMQYSCAYFADENTSLAEAQRRKKAHIAVKLLLSPGMKVLDIGCGWGGLAIFLAQKCGADVTGITLSEEQHRVATERVAKLGLEHKIRFYLRDFRDESGEYDRVVSIGMFEHVGAKFYKEYFRQIERLLKPEGVALVHSIGRTDGPEPTNPWLRKYIFPGAGAPALSEVIPVVEKSGLWTTDIEILRLHYAYTLKAWYTAFQQHRGEVAKLYDERFCRMWEFYLASAEMYFRYCGVMVFQMQMAKNITTVPITRDYMLTGEEELRKAA